MFLVKLWGKPDDSKFTIRFAIQLFEMGNFTVVWWDRLLPKKTVVTSVFLKRAHTISGFTIVKFRHNWIGAGSWRSTIWGLELLQLPQFLFLGADFYHRLCRIAKRIFLDHFQVTGFIFATVMTEISQEIKARSISSETSTVCPKNKKIEKVTVILVLRSWNVSCLLRSSCVFILLW